MASGYGKGARLYLQGPSAEGTPQQGYQLPLTPCELIQAGIADLNAFTLKSKGKLFKDLSPDDRAAVIRDVEGGKASFATVPPCTWFGELYQLVQEGCLGDPLYGGNKDKSVWKRSGTRVSP